MAEFLSQRLTARLGALLFVISGIVTIANLALPSPTPRNIPALVAIGGAAMLTGTVAWFLPWQRWRRSATLPMVPLAFVMIALGGMASLRPWSYAVYWVVAFVWIGAAHPRWMSVKFAVPATLGYVSPFFVVDHGGIDAFTSVGVVIPVCLLVGESLAWVTGLLRQAERLDLRRMTDMEALVQATVGLARQSDATAAADLAASLAVRLLRADAALVLLADEAGVLHAAGRSNWLVEVDDIEPTALDQPACDALRDGVLTFHAGRAVGPLTSATAGAPMVFLPLLAATTGLGLILVRLPTTSEGLDGFGSSIAQTFATQASLAFERLHATQVLRDASMRDALTGVGNRRQADALLAQSDPGDVFVLLDLDHFKAVNDRWGHAKGDEVLVALASFLDRSLRDGDSVARYGGEEFLVVLRAAGGNARTAIERLAEGWRRTDPIVTFSAGVAVHTADRTALESLAAADAALYSAKDAGRDCVRVCSDQGVPPEVMAR